jgi:hypothetical protein
MEAQRQQPHLTRRARFQIGATLRAMYEALEEDVPERLIHVLDGHPVESQPKRKTSADAPAKR